jgi:hypothetical protein
MRPYRRAQPARKIKLGSLWPAERILLKQTEAEKSILAGRIRRATPLSGRTAPMRLRPGIHALLPKQFYGGKRPYGYAFGGSGGAYRTVGGMENTQGVWDGVVPYVLGSPMAIPNVFSVRMNAMRVLKNKLPQIIDATEPGGSGDIFAGLNDEEREALQEATRLGFPPKSWFGYKTMGVHGFIAVYQGMTMADRKYFTDDFWKTPGYLGANPTASLLRARIQAGSKIKQGISVDQAVQLGLIESPSAGERGSADLAWKSMGEKEGTMPVAFQLEDVLPDVEFLGGDLLIKSGAAAGKTLQLAKIDGDKVILGPTDPSVLAKLRPGDEVQVDNSNFLAAQTYHRHQVPAPTIRWISLGCSRKGYLPAAAHAARTPVYQSGIRRIAGW